jgi:Na+/proline symporter
MGISATSAIVLTVLALGVFALVALAPGRATGRDDYLADRDHHRSGVLAFSFFASGLGGWILFAPPEVAVLDGGLGVLGYAIAAALPFLAFAWIGPRLRRIIPEGITLTDFVVRRFGRTLQAYVGVISVFYMFMFVTAELTAVGGVLELLAGVDPWVPIVLVATVTAAYTAIGGLPASIRTDRFQGWIILLLAGVAVTAVIVDVGDPVARARAGGLDDVSRRGLETMVVLAIAVTAANLFHQGYWQRTRAAVSDRELVRGAWGAAVLTIAVMLLVGATGLVAAGQGPVEVPSLAFFTLLTDLPDWVLLALVVLAVALVASSVDTLQNALVAAVAQDATSGRMPLSVARLVTVGLTIPAAYIAVQGYSVLRLFLVADLLAAATVVPVVLGLWRRTTPPAALAGAIAGLVAVVALGWVRDGTLADGFDLLTLPSGLDFGAFVIAPLVSGMVAVVVSLADSTVPAERDELLSPA